MNSEIERVKQDLETIRTAIDSAPRYGTDHVLAGAGVGVGCLLVTALVALQEPGWMFRGDGVHLTRSGAAVALALALVLGVAFLDRRFSPDFPLLFVMLPVLCGLYMITMAWGKRMRESVLVYGMIFLALRPKTTYTVTSAGRKAMAAYLSSMKSLIEYVEAVTL